MKPSEQVTAICEELALGCRPAPGVPESDWQRWLSGFKRPVTRTCARCGSPMRQRSGRFGDFWGCSRYPDCDHTEAIDE